MDKPRVLIVDDEETIRHILVNVISWNGCETREAASAEEGLSLLASFSPDVALLDIVLPGRSGLEMLKEIKQRSPDTEVVMMTSHASAETALRAIREGAYTYLQKPFENLDEIWLTLKRALEKRSLGEKERSLLQTHEERSRRLSDDIPLLETRPDGDDLSPYSDLLDYFMDIAIRELGVRGACMLLLDESGTELRPTCRRADGARAPARPHMPLGDGIWASVVRNGVPFVATAAATNGGNGGAPRADDALFQEPIALAVPIKSDRKVVGVFACPARPGGAPFSEAEIAHVVSLGSRLAAAIEGARRADQLEQAYASLKTTQEQLVRSERIKAIGQMAAGVAHDFNNALSIILARAEFIQRSLEGDAFDRAKALADLQTIIRTALQGAEAIKRIQEYTRIRKDHPRAAVDLNAAVRDAIEITRPKWKQESEAHGRRIEVDLDLGQLPQVNGNLFELTQVIENFIFNSVEAMPEGGRLGFKTWEEQGRVLLEVSDTGVGMDEETKQRLFEPFFTTKESGQGLGTSIIFGIIGRHRGRISVRSQPGSGTTFRIDLPPHVPGPVDGAAAQGAAQETPRAARVLLVDDEEGVRSAYEEALLSVGHEVVTASNGETALAAFAPGRFDVVITDLSMEGMSGYDVARAVRQRDPSVPVILLSGWAVEQQEEQVRQAGIDTVLIKPCPIQQLREVIQQTLRKRSGSGA
jgi:CheY-like chemotaxis protein